MRAAIMRGTFRRDQVKDQFISLALTEPRWSEGGYGVSVVRHMLYAHYKGEYAEAWFDMAVAMRVGYREGRTVGGIYPR